MGYILNITAFHFQTVYWQDLHGTARFCAAQQEISPAEGTQESNRAISEGY